METALYEHRISEANFFILVGLGEFNGVIIVANLVYHQSMS